MEKASVIYIYITYLMILILSSDQKSITERVKNFIFNPYFAINCAKYCQKNDGTLSLSMTEEKINPYLTIKISDSGREISLKSFRYLK